MPPTFHKTFDVLIAKWIVGGLICHFVLEEITPSTGEEGLAV